MANISVEFLGNSSFKLSSGQIIENVHLVGTCLGEFCPIHNPSDHDFRDFPLVFTGVNMLREFPDGTLIPDPDDYSYNKGNPVILENSAKCYKCETTVKSISRHDFQECSCGNVFVDGGYNYIRQGFLEGQYYENTSLTTTKKRAS